MQVCSEFEALLALTLVAGLGPRRIQHLRQYFGTALAAWQASDAHWAQSGLAASVLAARKAPQLVSLLEDALAWQAKPGHYCLALGDAQYPALLAELEDAPPVLYVAGCLALLDRPQIAVVGSRNAGALGLEQARSFAQALADAGFVVTSGLALGVDAAAHRGALQAKDGRTLAVLGTGLKRLYPRQHQLLASQIVAQGGVLVSEFPLQTPPQAHNFPRRNRIISGLSLGVLVVEATCSSGSLITARLAAEQGREVFAIPGSIQYAGARGCHQLIREGALLVEQVGDILEALQGWHSLGVAPEVPLSKTPIKQAESPLYKDHPWLAQLHAAPLSTEALAGLAQVPMVQLLGLLTELEIEGVLRCEQGLWRLG